MVFTMLKNFRIKHLKNFKVQFLEGKITVNPKKGFGEKKKGGIDHSLFILQLNLPRHHLVLNKGKLQD